MKLYTFAEAVEKLENEEGAIHHYGNYYPLWVKNKDGVHKRKEPFSIWWKPSLYVCNVGYQSSLSEKQYGELNPPMFNLHDQQSADWVYVPKEEIEAADQKIKEAQEEYQKKLEQDWQTTAKELEKQEANTVSKSWFNIWKG